MSTTTIRNVLSRSLTDILNSELYLSSNLQEHVKTASTSESANHGKDDWLRILDNICTTDIVNESFKSLFPLSERPWSEPIKEGLVSACPSHASDLLPSQSLLAEASFMIKVAEAERAVRIAEAELYRLRARENLLRANLFQLQAAMEARLVQISDNRIGQARAEQERIACNFQSHTMENLRVPQMQSSAGIA